MKSFAGRELGLWLAALLQFILQGLILRALAHLAHGEIIDPAAARLFSACIRLTS